MFFHISGAKSTLCNVLIKVSPLSSHIVYVLTLFVFPSCDVRHWYVRFSFFNNESVGFVGGLFGCFNGMGSVVIVLTGIKSIGDVVWLVVFVQKVVDSKGG